jgi:hypothetical protein
MSARNRRRPLSTQGRPEPIGIQPPKPRPTPGKPHYFRLIVELNVGTGIAPVREAVTLVERGPLGLCEQRGMEAANYGAFQLCADGTREWYRPMRVLIEPVKKDDERSEGDGSHSEADS